TPIPVPNLHTLHNSMLARRIRVYRTSTQTSLWRITNRPKTRTTTGLWTLWRFQEGTPAKKRSSKYERPWDLGTSSAIAAAWSETYGSRREVTDRCSAGGPDR